MKPGRFAIIDPAAGIGGDMLLGALLDAGAPEEWLRRLPARLGFPEISVEIARVVRCGIAARKVSVRLADGKIEHPSPEFPATPHLHAGHDHAPDVHPGHQGDHHHLAELLSVVEGAPLSPWVRQRATQALRLLAEEEGRIHGVSAEAVALHEVGAIDALIDIVGAIEGFEQLGIEQVYVRPVAVGSGWVRTAHGVMAVPTPVTTRLLEGLEIGPNGPVIGEATTPTGAVLLRVLTSGSPPARWRIVASGWGAGGRDPEHYANALRLLLAEPVSEAGEVVTLSTDLDDLSPEYLEPLREALTAAGAIDMQVWSTQMKKGRVGFRVEIIVDPAHSDAVTQALFLHSTTAGVRRWVAERVTLSRRQLEVEAAPGVSVRVKVLDAPDGPRAKPEYDDVSAAAKQLGRPAHLIAREVQNRALALLRGEAAQSTPTPNEE